MAEILAGLFLALLVLALGLHVFGLPANWVILALTAIWIGTHPQGELGWSIFVVLVLLAAGAEVLEFLVQRAGSKRYGASVKGNWGGIVGAILGAFAGAPFLFGIGALPGALVGAFGGCFIVEKLQGRDFAEAKRAAMGAMWGKFFGLTVKVGVGVLILALAVPRIWPG